MNVWVKCALWPVHIQVSFSGGYTPSYPDYVKVTVIRWNYTLTSASEVQQIIYICWNFLCLYCNCTLSVLNGFCARIHTFFRLYMHYLGHISMEVCICAVQIQSQLFLWFHFIHQDSKHVPNECCEEWGLSCVWHDLSWCFLHQYHIYEPHPTCMFCIRSGLLS